MLIQVGKTEAHRHVPLVLIGFKDAETFLFWRIASCGLRVHLDLRTRMGQQREQLKESPVLFISLLGQYLEMMHPSHPVICLSIAF